MSGPKTKIWHSPCHDVDQCFESIINKRFNISNNICFIKHLLLAKKYMKIKSIRLSQRRLLQEIFAQIHSKLRSRGIGKYELCYSWCDKSWIFFPLTMLGIWKWIYKTNMLSGMIYLFSLTLEYDRFIELSIALFQFNLFFLFPAIGFLFISVASPVLWKLVVKPIG